MAVMVLLDLKAPKVNLVNLDNVVHLVIPVTLVCLVKMDVME